MVFRQPFRLPENHHLTVKTKKQGIRCSSNKRRIQESDLRRLPETHYLGVKKQGAVLDN